jgi:diguanylate cyclase (GGDEF)-like protein
MAADINKHLDRARRNLEKNKLRDAITEYQAVVDQAPGHTEAVQALADIYTRLNEPAQAANFYGSQFDRLLEVGDAAKASAIFARFLRSFPQPPDRLMRYAALLQRQNKHSEAVEQYGAAAQLFLQQHRDIEALACYESIALLDPENSARHVTLGELAERLRHADLAARSFLRAGQLVLTSGALDEALEYFGRSHALAPQDRSGALLFAEAKLRKGDTVGAVALLEPLTPNEKDLTFLALFGESLLRTGRLDRAHEIFELFYTQKPEGFAKLFEVAAAYLRAGDDAKAASVLVHAKDRMRKARKEAELGLQMDRLAAAHPNSLLLAETVARTYEELNREAKYFDALVRLFDLYLAAGRIKEACDTLDRLVDIDPYDYRNHERIAKLEGKADPPFLQNVLARAAKAATVSTRSDGFAGAGSDTTAVSASEDFRSSQALEDLIVQVEIFLQYSLQSKAIERLTKIAELFPGEEETDERLRSLYDRANWWPNGEPTKRVVAPPPAAPAPVPADSAVPAQPAAVNPAETHRDLATIAEINRLMYRQSTPREVIAATAAEIGKHLSAARCLISIGGAAEAGQLTAEYFGPGLAASADAIPSILALASKATADPLGGIELNTKNAAVLGELGLESALAVVLTDKETQAPSGTLLVGDAHARKWKPNESFFLQAIGDQLVLSVNHTRLRSLVRSLAVADEKTGLLSRGAYLDCLLAESNRARPQGTSLSLVLLQVNRGAELLREHGDAVDRYVEQLARALSSAVRQTDIVVKYTAWSLAFILPNTSVDDARAIAEKLIQVAGTVRPSWAGVDLTVSAVAAEATSRPSDETEDRVTEWINRAEAGLDEVRQRGGSSFVALATP